MKPHFLLVLLAAIALSACSKPTYQGTSLAYNQDFSVLIGEKDKDTGAYNVRVERKGGTEWFGEELTCETCEPARKEALMNVTKMEAAKICTNGEVAEFVGEPEYANVSSDNAAANAGGGFGALGVLLAQGMASAMASGEGPFSVYTSFKCVAGNSAAALAAY
jgi:hypothetical protein